MTSQLPATGPTTRAQSDPSAPPLAVLPDTSTTLFESSATNSSGRLRRRRLRLPITGDLSLAYVLSLVIAMLMSVSSLAGLLAGRHIYPASQLSGNAGTDTLTLVVGLPLLLGSMWFARHGSLVGLLCWPGALFTSTMSRPSRSQRPLNALFLPMSCSSRSAPTRPSAWSRASGARGRQQFSSRVPARAIGGALIAIALLFTIVDTAMIGAALASGAAIDATTHVSWIVDFVIELPALLIAGILLWRHEALGYVAAPALLLQGGALTLASRLCWCSRPSLPLHRLMVLLLPSSS